MSRERYTLLVVPHREAAIRAGMNPPTNRHHRRETLIFWWATQPIDRLRGFDFEAIMFFDRPPQHIYEALLRFRRHDTVWIDP